jgi:hypothetical protein
MSDERKTDPDNLRPSQPLMDMRESFALGQALHGLDALAKFMGGKLHGDVAEVANQIGTALFAKQSEFEAKTDKKLDRILYNQSLMMATLKPLGIHVGELQAEHARNHGPVELRLSEPPKSEPEQEAQEG